jgi:hypothetical protein
MSGKCVRSVLGVLAGSGIVPSEVLSRVASEAGLRLEAFGLTVHRVADEHAETL